MIKGCGVKEGEDDQAEAAARGRADEGEISQSGQAES
jgi:hypothetical protein